ncbi:MAG: FtsH protease activity modulator HflK [Vulcanimicrobiota bacterium]
MTDKKHEHHEQDYPVTPKKVLFKMPDKIDKAAPHIVLIIVIFVFLALFLTCFYTVQPEEVGVLQRLGRYIETTGPGLHFKLPFGIDHLKKVKIQRIYKEEFGFRTVKSGVRSEFEPNKKIDEALMLTGDLNSVVVEWIVQYKIKDPVKYLFNIRNPNKTIRDLSESVMREVVGDRAVDEVLTIGRMEIETEVQKHLQDIFNYYDMGVEIITVKLQNVNPPDPVKPSFNDVNEAKQDKERLINEAWKEYNTVIPLADGEKKKMIQFAEGYAIERTNEAKGNTARFIKLFNEYRKARQITRKRLYLEEMQKVLKKVKRIFIIDKNARSILPFIQLGDKVHEGGEGK